MLFMGMDLVLEYDLELIGCLVVRDVIRFDVVVSVMLI